MGEAEFEAQVQLAALPAMLTGFLDLIALEIKEAELTAYWHMGLMALCWCLYGADFLKAAGVAGEGTYVISVGMPPELLTGKGADWYKRYANQFNPGPDFGAMSAISGIE